MDRLMRTLGLAIAATLVASATPAAADADLQQQLAKPIVAALNSSKQPAELQLCAADAIGEGLLPVPFAADASGTVHIFGFAGLMGAGTVQRVVSLVKAPQGTRLEIRTRSGRPDQNLVDVLRGCL
jgi:hypothetical protein